VFFLNKEQGTTTKNRAFAPGYHHQLNKPLMG